MRVSTLRVGFGLGAIVIALGVSARLSARLQDPTDGELRRLNDAYAQAWAKADAKALTALYTSEAVRLGPEGKVSVGRAAIEQALNESLRGPYRTTKIGLTSGQTTRAAQDAYVSEGNYVIAGGMPPAGAPTRGKYIHTLVRSNGRWQIAGEGFITPPPPRAAK